MSSTRLKAQGSPIGLQRLLLRAPIVLYQARLGFLLGKRFLMLEHTGRKTGRVRRTVLEVVAKDSDAVYVAAAWGSSAQWLKNVRAKPEVTFSTGIHRHRTLAQEVSMDRRFELMDRYARNHPRALNRLAAFMFENPAKPAVEQARQVAAAVPMVRLSTDGYL